MAPFFVWGSYVSVCVTHIHIVALAQVVGEVVLDLADKFLCILGVEAQHLAQPLQADVLQVTVG